MVGIYKITSPSGKVYIGSSINIEKRIRHYKCSDCRNQIRLFYSLKKYGWLEHLFEILEECSKEQLYKRERYYGVLYDVLGQRGLNSMLPKNGELKVGVSEDTRTKMSKSKLGSLNTFFGKTHSEETKKKISLCQTGRKHTLEHRLKVSQNNAKNLAKIVLDLNTGVFYESGKEASFYANIKHSTLRCMLNGTNKNRTSFVYC